MRQLVRVAVVSGVLLGVLAWPAPVAAETAEQCLTALNGYRRTAGLDRASATSIPALAKAATNHAAYRVNVDRGNDDLFRSLGLPDFGLFGPDRTAHLETPALTRLGFTGANPWDRTKAAKLADGTWRYQYEDVTTATGISAANLRGVRSWIDAPYHRLPLMDANTRHVGCAAAQRGDYSAQVLEMAATWKDTTKRITVYPASGQKGVPASFNRCQEHPTPFGGTCAAASPIQLVGYVVTLQADGYYAMKVQGIAFSKGSARTPVDIHRAVRYRTTKTTVPVSAADTNLPANAAMLAAKSPPGREHDLQRPRLRLRAGGQGRQVGPVQDPDLVVHHRLTGVRRPGRGRAGCRRGRGRARPGPAPTPARTGGPAARGGRY